jgi:hypothetical protein
MEKKSFLPDGSTVRAQLLARVPYSQDVLDEIARGADPSNYRPSLNGIIAWGILYISDSGAGFYSSRVNQTVLGFSTDSGGEDQGPIHLRFPMDAGTTLEIMRKKKPSGKIGVLLSHFILGEDDTILIRWKGKHGPYELRFFVARGDVDEFERAFHT